MTVIVGGHPISQVPNTVTEIYRRFPSLQTEATKLVLKPLLTFDQPEGVMYVTQKEYAVLKSDDQNFTVLGTDDATTCHIVVMVNREESTVCLAHVDSTDDLKELTSMVLDIIGHQDVHGDFHLELSILGGYLDEMHKSEILTLDLLQFYNQLPVKFLLKQFCVNTLNTRSSEGVNWPIIYGATVDLRTDFTISPAKFSLNVRGPCKTLRSSRFLSSQCVLHRYGLRCSFAFIFKM